MRRGQPVLPAPFALCGLPRPRTGPALAAGLALALLAGLCGPAQAQWKWREGKDTLYSDRPPPRHVKEQDILQRPAAARSPAALLPVAAASAASAPAAPASDPALEARRRQAEAQEAARRQADEARLAQLRTDNCQRARDHARTLESGLRLRRLDASGAPVVLDERARSDELAAARQVIASDCKSQ